MFWMFKQVRSGLTKSHSVNPKFGQYGSHAYNVQISSKKPHKIDGDGWLQCDQIWLILKRLGDTFFLTKIAKMSGDFGAIMNEKCHLLSKHCSGYVLATFEKIGLLFTPLSDHTGWLHCREVSIRTIDSTPSRVKCIANFFSQIIFLGFVFFQKEICRLRLWRRYEELCSNLFESFSPMP